MSNRDDSPETDPERGNAPGPDEQTEAERTIATPRRAGAASSGQPAAEAGETGGPGDQDEPGEDRTIVAPRKPKAAPKGAPKGAAAAEPSDPMTGLKRGDCVLEDLIGKGAMGAVYRAKQIDLDRTVAVKLIRPEYGNDPHLLKRFQHEAKTVAKFSTEHVVQIHQVGFEGHHNFLVMEYVAGGSLRDQAQKQPGQRLGTDDSIRFLRQSAVGLKEAQAHGVLHRDIKPDNLLLDDKGKVKIADFGIAKVLSDDVGMTATSDLMGTPLYMSPEQCRGDELDFRSDMYSLGASFYYLLTGKPPAKGSSVYELIQTKTKIQFLSPARALPDMKISGPLSRVIETMTALDKKNRYGSYDELIDDLERIEAGAEPIAPPPPERTRPKQGAGAGRLVAAVVLVGGLAAGGYWLWTRPAGGGTPPVIDGPPSPNGGGAHAQEIAAYDASLTALRAKLDAESPEQVEGEVKALVQAIRDERHADFAQVLGRATALDGEVTRRIGDTRTQRQLAQWGDALGALEERREAEDLNAVVVELDALIGDLQTEGAAKSLLDRARVLKIDVKKNRYTRRLADCAARLAGSGPKTVSAEATQLVTDLANEPVEFDDLRNGATGLAADVTVALQIEQALQIRQHPKMEPPFAALKDHMAFLREKLNPGAGQTEAFKQWIESERATRLADQALEANATQALTTAWQTCQATKEAADSEGFLDLYKKLLESRTNLAEAFGEGFDFEATVPAKKLDELVAWFQAEAEGEELATRIDNLAEEMGKVSSLSTWLALGEKLVEARERQGDAAKNHPELLTRFAGIDRELAFWKESTAAMDAALGRLAAHEVKAAQRVLERFAEGSHDPTRIAEFVALRNACKRIDDAFDLLFSKLQIDRAQEELDSARSELIKLPKAPAERALAYVDGCLARLGQVKGAVADMAPVPGAAVVVDDQSVLVAGFFVDCWEASRTQFDGYLTDSGQPGRFADKPDYPANGVTFDDALACVRHYRKELPTRQEWQLAAKGPGAGSDYPWGPTWAASRVPGLLKPVRDGEQKQLGGRGMCYLAGNVAEWLAPASSGRARLAGGSFRDTAAQKKQRARGDSLPNMPTGHVDEGFGFRGVLRPMAFFAGLEPK